MSQTKTPVILLLRVISLDKEFLLFRGNAVSKRRYMQSQNQQVLDTRYKECHPETDSQFIRNSNETQFQASPLFGGGAAEFTDDRVSLLRDETDLELGNLNDEAGSSSNGTRGKDILHFYEDLQTRKGISDFPVEIFISRTTPLHSQFWLSVKVS